MAVFTGSDADDNYQGTDEADQINGAGGNDIVYGRGGSDQIRGGDGIDLLAGEDGDDYLYAGGSSEFDPYKDYLYGGAGADTLDGGVGDEFDGGTNPDGRGDFAYINLKSLTISVVLDMNRGYIQAIAGGGSITNVEKIELWSGSAADRIKGAGDDDWIMGGGGHDALYGGGGEDTLHGQADNDVLRGEGGDDTLTGGAGRDRLIGGDGWDFIRGDQASAQPADGADQLSGGEGNDILLGDGGDDILIGGGDDDDISGGLGADIFVFSGLNQGDDRIRDFSAAQGDRFDLDGKQFTSAVSTNGYTVLAWQGGKVTVENAVMTLAEANSLIVTGGNTLVRLTDAFDNMLRYGPASDADRAYVQGLNDKIIAGQITEAGAVRTIIDQADASTGVAVVSYAFFTGKTPSEDGMDYLLSPVGPNPNNLNSAYYQSFNLENRYINFAVNLGRDGDGSTAFKAKYGGVSLFEATRMAYGEIFGVRPDDEKVHSLIDTRIDYFKAYGVSDTAARSDLGTKAAMVGWLLAEAMKGDVGAYAKGSNAYLADLADGGPFSVDIVGPIYQSLIEA